MNARDPCGAASRRTFLKTVGGAVGAAALPLGPARGAAPSAAERRRWDVVVIGGGFAGVSAARELRHAGLETLLLEARNRLGGRTFTARSGGRLFELGGTWVHSTQPHVFAEVNRYGLELVETQGEIPERLLWWDGERAREAGLRELPSLAREAVCAPPGGTPEAPTAVLAGLARLARQMSDFHADARAALPEPYGPLAGDAWRKADARSVRDRLDQLDLGGAHRGLLEGVLGASAHGDFSEASLLEMLRWWALSGHDLQRYSDSVARYRLRNGTISLIEAMLDDGRPEVRLGAPVAEVAHDADGVGVTTEGGERFEARAALAALPMNVLANVRFTPALHPGKLAASRERHAGAGVKLYLRLAEPLSPLAIFAPESEPLSSVFTMADGEHGDELVAFGTDPGRIDAHDPGAVERVLQRFVPEARVVETVAYDWHLDPRSLGTWCVLRKGQASRYLDALRASEGRVHFAGADQAFGWRGFIDGAIESGTRVGRQLAARLAGRAEAGDAPGRAQGRLASGLAAATGGDEAVAEALRPCAVCHPTDASGRSGVGPNLRGVHGRAAASVPGYPYSEAMRARGITWNDARLDAFLADPAAFVPGTSMPFSGIADPAARAELIRLLRGLR